jgi:hypothetical protein
MKYIIPILLIILIISLFFENAFIEPLSSSELADFPEVYGGDINYVSKSDQKTIIIRDFDREDYYKEDEEYIKIAKNRKTTTYEPVNSLLSSITETPFQTSTSNVPMTTTFVKPTVVRHTLTPTSTRPSMSMTPTMQTTPSMSRTPTMQTTSNTPIY